MRILFVLSNLPYPPRDGSTIPTYNYLYRLAKIYDVAILYIKDKQVEVNKEQLKKNIALAKQFWIIEASQASTLSRVKNEFSLKKPFFFRQLVDFEQVAEKIKNQSFDLVWVSSITLSETIASIKKIVSPNPICLLGLSDSNTAVLRLLGKRVATKSLDVKTRLIYLASFFRSFLVSRIESKILKTYDIILVQTDQDFKWIERISNGHLNSKILVLPNGVNKELFSLPIHRPKNGLLFLGILNNGYGKSLEWLLDNVWEKIKNQTNTQLFIIGRGASETLKLRMNNDSNIIYNEFVPDICDVFKNRAVMLAPVFKGYGLINKVVESMAAGVPVVGTADSFNGIPDFNNNVHGVISQSADEFIGNTINLIKNYDLNKKIALSARELVQKHFLWEDRVFKLLEKIKIW